MAIFFGYFAIHHGRGLTNWVRSSWKSLDLTNGCSAWFRGVGIFGSITGSRLRTRVKTQRNELHNRNCTIVRTKCSNPYNVGWGGYLYPQTLLHHTKKCPSGPHEGQEITLGVFGNFPKSDSPTCILLLGSHVSCPSGTFGSGLQQASCGAAFIVRHS